MNYYNILSADENDIAVQQTSFDDIAISKETVQSAVSYTHLWASLIRFIVLNFVLTCVWFFGFGLGFDAIKAATGPQLKGTMTVTGVVQEDGLTLSVKDPNKGKHVV